MSSFVLIYGFSIPKYSGRFCDELTKNRGQDSSDPGFFCEGSAVLEIQHETDILPLCFFKYMAGADHILNGHTHGSGQ